MTEPASGAGEPIARYSRTWSGFYAVTALAVTAAVLAQSGTAVASRSVAVGAVAFGALLFAGWGRREGAGVPFVVVLLATFLVGTTAVSTVSYLLFALCPLIFMLLEIRPAVIAVVCANMVPLVGGLLRDGAASYLITELAPIFVMTAAASVWLGVWINRVVEQSKERASLIAELESSRAEVARLSHETGIAAERARLAGEIHDTLAQGFTSIITLLQAVDPALADERLALAVRTARENLAEARALVTTLAPAALTAGSLPDAVRRQTTRFAEESGIPATYRLTGDTRPLPTAVEVVLLRAAQEALTNVRRHAEAHEVAVLLAYGAGSVRLVVRDDGRGFDTAAGSGFGLPGMRTRAEQVNGTLTVRSDPETGTLIEVEVPA